MPAPPLTDAPALPDIRPFAELARGPMASVYKAVDRATGETVLLKQLRPAAAADPERRARFAAEARLAATVRHPNVVRIRHATDDAIVADWVEGADLGATLDAHGPLPPALAAFVAAEAARGLAAVHAAGILHRDVAAANVLVGADGAVRLTDFGLASLADDADPADHGHEVRGTLATLAPEVVTGGAATPAADVFGLGAVLAHALTGRAPFAAPTASDTLDAVLHTDVAGALAADARVPPALARVAAAMLAPAPDARPSAADAADALAALSPATPDDLAAWLADPTTPLPPLAESTPTQAEPAEVPAPPPVPPVAPTRRAARWLVGAGIVGALAVAALLARPDPAPVPLPPAGRDAPPAVALVPPDSSADDATGTRPDDGLAVLVPEASPAPPGPPPSTPGTAAAPTVPREATRRDDPPEPSRTDPRPETRPEARPDAAPEAPGALTVVAEPWANVRVNGRAVGTTPVAALPLAAGVYEVSFENPAFPAHSVRIRVQPGETARAEVSLWSLVARVTLDVAPWAEVSVDGRVWGTVPPQDRPLVLPPGSYTLSFVHPTLGRREVPLRVAAGETRTVRVRLTEPAP